MRAIEQLVREVEARNGCSHEEANEAIAFFNALAERLTRGELTNEDEVDAEVVAFSLAQIARRYRALSRARGQRQPRYAPRLLASWRRIVR